MENAGTAAAAAKRFMARKTERQQVSDLQSTIRSVSTSGSLDTTGAVVGLRPDVHYEGESGDFKKPELGNKGVFGGVNLDATTASGVVSLVERYFISTRGMRRALTMKAYEGDILVCSPERSGEGIITCMLHLLSTGAKGCQPQKQLDVDIPWIESRLFDENPRALDALQEGSLRIYKSTMSHKAVSEKVNSEAKFVTILRDPKDYRLGYYTFLNALYQKGSKSPYAKSFEERFSFDDISRVPTPFCHGFEGPVTYEQNVVDWVTAAKKKSNIHVVFYEDLIHDRRTVLEELANFVGINMDQALRTAILNYTYPMRLKGLYGLTELFGAVETEVDVGRAVSVLSPESNRQLNQAWTKAVVTIGGKKYKDYASLYSEVTGRNYPFQFRTEAIPNRSIWRLFCMSKQEKTANQPQLLFTPR
mmetsp:Transcript_3729/g.7232  ORF Transcript_3729/g.7232 Transcript_3729/m.7232 type:complete len:419 (+) Transcript_3729:171-1427(+)